MSGELGEQHTQHKVRPPKTGVPHHELVRELLPEFDAVERHLAVFASHP